MLLGAVGQLQFEVVQHRLKAEYDADVRLEGCQYTGARWITADTPAELRAFTDAYPQRMALRRGRRAGLPVHLALRRAAGAGALPEDPFPSAARARGPGAADGRLMQPLTHGRSPARRELVGVLTDIDDTLTTEGAITPDALQALAALQAAGLHVRRHHRPAGGLERAVRRRRGRSMRSSPRTARSRWCARAGGGLRKRLRSRTQPTRARNFARMQQVAAAHRARGARRALAHDSAGRETDIAIDHSEFAHLTHEQIAQVVALMQREGHARHRQLDPRQRLVRRPQQADAARAGSCASCCGRDLDARDARAGSTSATRPTTR